MADSADTLFQQAFELHLAGRLPEAAVLYQRILAGAPDHAEVLYLLGAIAHQVGEPARTVELVRRSLAIQPDEARGHNLLGLGLMELGMTEEAEASFRRAIALEESADGYNNLGILCKRQGRFDEAAAAYRQALTRAPASAFAHYNLGNVLRATQAVEEAAQCFRRALECDSRHSGAMAALGQVLLGLGRAAEALPLLEQALALAPGDSDLHCDAGDALQALGQFEAAVAAYRRALELNPKMARPWYSAGCAESARQEYVTAAGCFRQALALHAEWPEAQHNLGQALFQLGQAEEAMHLFADATVRSDPGMPLEAIAVLIPGDPASDNQSVLEARCAWAERCLPRRTPAQAGRPVKNRPLRVGYISSFFQDENWMKPVWGLINRHDRDRLELHLFSDGPAPEARHGYRVHPRDVTYNIASLSNEAVAARMRDAGIDLLVDLNGYSKTGRLPLMNLRPAPVIAGWFNLYATSGIEGYDYLVGDDYVIPPEEERFYSEKIVRVPGSYLTFEVNYPVPDVAEAPSGGRGPITFGCLAPQYKITGHAIAAWSSILLQVPESTLVLKSRALASKGVRRFVQEQFSRHGVDGERVRLEGPAEHFRFLETYGEIDLALDTFPYNGGTTTSEAIWQGVPVVAFSGDRWVSRTSSSILHAAGLGEFVGRTLDDYIAIAVRAANTPERLAELRRNMRARLRDSAVCDTRTFARNMERIYSEIV